MGGESSAVVNSVLGEIAARLSALAASGETAAIDLLSLPMQPQDLAALSDRLGFGEVAAMIEATGTTEIRETGHAGVWWVQQLGVGGRVLAERIEIAAVPEILVADRAEIAAAAARLARDLANLSSGVSKDEEKADA
jgi:hydrogenase-1 operon protein HyaF